MKKMFVAGCLLASCFLLQAQTTGEGTAKANPQKRLDELKGTYELRYTTRALALLPSNLAEIIELNRKKTEVNTIRLNENVEVLIYPLNQISTNSTKNKE